MKKISAVVAMLAVTAFAGAAFAAAAPNSVELPASFGKVAFPHAKHVEVLKDCTKCHETKEGGKIAKLGKDWAHNVNCKKCHTDMKAEGKKTGPTLCKDCHKK